jgi:hypothetical protein
LLCIIIVLNTYLDLNTNDNYPFRQPRPEISLQKIKKEANNVALQAKANISMRPEAALLTTVEAARPYEDEESDYGKVGRDPHGMADGQGSVPGPSVKEDQNSIKR